MANETFIQHWYTSVPSGNSESLVGIWKLPIELMNWTKCLRNEFSFEIIGSNCNETLVCFKKNQRSKVKWWIHRSCPPLFFPISMYECRVAGIKLCCAGCGADWSVPSSTSLQGWCGPGACSAPPSRSGWSAWAACSPSRYSSRFYPVLWMDVTFSYGFGSVDPSLWPVDPDPDPDPAIFVLEFQHANRKTIFLLITVLFEGTFT